MDLLLNFFLKNGLQPLLIDKELNEIAKNLSRSELITLIAISQRNQATNLQLANDIGVPAKEVTHIRLRLSKRGLIKQTKDSTGYRFLIELTPIGQELAEKALKIINLVITKINESLSVEEINQLVKSMEKVRNVAKTIKYELLEEIDLID